MKRKPLTKRQVIQVLLNQGAVIPCGHCRKQIANAKDAIDEHLHQLGTGGSDDDLSNRQFWHVACSAKKTYGTKASSAGSDAHTRAKIKRAHKPPRPKRKLPSRPFPKRPHPQRNSEHG